MKMNKDLEKAVLLGNLSLTKALLKAGCEIDGTDRYGRTILFDAIVKGYQEIVFELCLSKTNVNHQDKEGRTPLHFSAIHSQFEIAKILIQFGAIIDVTDENGNTPLANAVFYSHEKKDLILLLKANGADYNKKNNYDISPKELAESIDDYEFPDIFD
jgi:ankyrin repeat protein